MLAMSRGKRLLIVIILLVVTFVGLVIAIPVGLIIIANVARLREVARITNREAYEPVARVLALHCQSNPDFYRNESPIIQPWAPPEVTRLNASTLFIRPGEAVVGFGDEFHPYSYGLSRDRGRDTATENGWKLEVYPNGFPESGSGRLLMTFTLNKTDHVEQRAFVDQAMAEYRRRQLSNEFHAQGRLIFLLKLNEVELARQSIREFATASPNDSVDHMLLWIIDHRVNPDATRQFEDWATSTGKTSSWLMVAYTYGQEGGQANDDAMERAAKRALTMNLDEPHTAYNVHIAYNVCRRLFLARKYETSADLCDAVITYFEKHEMGTLRLKTELKAFRDEARKHSVSLPATSIPERSLEMMPAEYFMEIDWHRLVILPGKNQ
jgi:hypothetical protein